MRFGVGFQILILLCLPRIDGYGQTSASARALNQAGRDAYANGYTDRALDFYRQAESAALREGSPLETGRALNFRGIIFNDLGVLDSALACFNRALTSFVAAGDSTRIGAALNGRGQAYIGLGKIDSALVDLRTATRILAAAGEEGSNADVINNLGFVFRVLRQPDSAFYYYRRGLALVRGMRNGTGKGIFLLNIGLVFDDFRQLDSAVAYYRLAADTSSAEDDPFTTNTARNNLGVVYRRLGQADSALATYAVALAESRRSGDSALEATTLHNIGLVYFDLRRQDSALAYYSQALVRYRHQRNALNEWELLKDIGDAYATLSPRRWAPGAAYYDSAAFVLSGLGRQAGGDANRLSFAEQQSGLTLFEGWSLALLRQGNGVAGNRNALAALGAVERGRAQALLDLLRGPGVPVAAGADLASEAAGMLTAVQQPHTAVISYLITADTLFSWLLLPDRNVSVHRVPVQRDSLAAAIAQVRARINPEGSTSLRGLDGAEPTRGLGFGPDTARMQAAIRRLSAWLIPAAVRQQLETVKEIVVIPQGPIGLVPFAALSMNRSQSLGERYAIRYAPSLATLVEVEQRPRTNGEGVALVVGNPAMPTVTLPNGGRRVLDSLPGAEREGLTIADRLRTTAQSGEAASETRVLASLAGAPLIHLATHGFAYSSDTQFRNSFIALAPDNVNDGLLTVGEILDTPGLRLKAELVVLSACETGLGNLKQAEGTVGLQRAFLARGAAGVLVSLWNVSDEATEMLMGQFYSHWLDDEDKPGKSEALRRAQEDVRKRFPQPQFWAAFQLVGAR